MRNAVTRGIVVLLLVAVVALGLYSMGVFDGEDVTHVDGLEYSIGEFSFSGETVNGLFSGLGAINLKNGNIYTGIFENGRFSGDGAYYYSGSATTDAWHFDGVFDNGHAADGAFYASDGSIVSVNCDSTAVSLSGSGWRYTGGFNERGQNGAGTFTFKDGSVYTGGFLNGLATGEGSFTDPLGNVVYTGRFENGLFDGQGAYFSPEGWSYEGSFKAGQFDGEGSVTYGERVVWGIWEKGVQIERYE